jgi:hypothetical protein
VSIVPPSNPWQVAPLGEYRYKFTNVSGRKLAMIAVDPFAGGEAEVEGSPHPHTVQSPVEPGGSFTARVRGSVRIMATDPTTYDNLPWKFDAP